MKNKAALRPRDFLALMVIFVGCAGFLLWGLGYSTIGTPIMRWLGASIVALISFVLALLSRWFL